MLAFTKMHGAGNDFVVLDLRAGQALPDAGLCRFLADRHRGVGCDQILTIEPPSRADAHVRYGIWNSDGSRAGQCGNGARCVAAWFVRAEGWTGDLWLESPAGLHPAQSLGSGVWRIGMGQPDFSPAALPMRALAEDALLHEIPVAGELIRLGVVSLGNPHAVLQVGDVSTAEVARLGPAVQASGFFPDSVNVGFAQVLDRGHLRLRVYERGAGETLACGSGACAAAVVLMRQGQLERQVQVALPGGVLRIEWDEATGEIHMSGPTAFVFDGMIRQNFAEAMNA